MTTKTYLLMPVGPNAPDDTELTAEDKQELVKDLQCYTVKEIVEALTSAGEPEDLIELVKLLTAHVNADGRARS